MQLIAAAEGERRGLYGGAVGYLGYDGNLDTAITIRSAVLNDGRAHIHTGAGIVAGSVPESEFEETEHKAAALRRAIELAAAPADPPRNRPEPRPPAPGPAVGARRNDPGHRQLRLLHVQPRAGARRPPARGAGSSATTRSTGPGSRRSPTDPAADLRGIVISPGPGDPDDGRRLDRRDPGRGARDAPAARRLPRHAVDGRRVRGLDRPRPDPRPRRGVRGHPRRRGPARRACRRRSWPRATTRWPSTPATLPPELRVTAMSEVDRRRHGPAPHEPAAGRRPVPPRVRPDAGRPAPPRELPAPGGRRRGGAARCGDGSFATAAWPSRRAAGARAATTPVTAHRRRRDTPTATNRTPAVAGPTMSDVVRAALATVVDGGTLSPRGGARPRWAP